MIDKLDVRVPAKAQFAPGFDCLFKKIQRDPRLNPFRQSNYYAAVADLREFGYDAILHSRLKHRKERTSKLELVDMEHMTYAGLIHEIERVFAVDATTLKTMRIDLAVDIPNLPVSWFYPRLRAKHKPSSQFGALQLTHGNMPTVETIYLGKRPNCFRIYDKTAELQHQYSKLIKKTPDAEISSFEEIYNMPKDQILTRIERQMGGSRKIEFEEQSGSEMTHAVVESGNSVSQQSAYLNGAAVSSLGGMLPT